MHTHKRLGLLTTFDIIASLVIVIVVTIIIIVIINHIYWHLAALQLDK